MHTEQRLRITFDEKETKFADCLDIGIAGLT